MIPIIAAAAVAFAVIVLAALYFKNYIKVPPNEVAVFTGRGQVKVVRGGGRFKIPGIERVDRMTIEPFNVDVQLSEAFSKEGVAVRVEAVALVRFGSAEETIKTAVERFLTAPREKMEAQAREIVAGNLRSVVANMTVEELNASREQLSNSVLEEAASSFGRIGMELEVLTIQTIQDEKGYLEALGRKRIAEIKRDAEIGEAEAKRDSQIKSAAAAQQGETAQANAAIAISDANKERDMRIAENAGQVAAQTATAEQAGPLAKAQAEKGVAIAEEEAKAAREQAAIAVEKQRVGRQEAAQQADVVVPAEARKQAAELDATAAKITTVKAAEAEAEKVSLLAAAHQTELLANAAGEQAGLEAEAAGRQKLAEALNAYSEASIRLQILPELIGKLPEMTEAVSAAYSNIDNYVVIDAGANGDGDDNLLSKLIVAAPAALYTTMEAMKAVTGVDVAALAGGKALLNKETPAGTPKAKPEETVSEEIREFVTS